MPKYFDIHSHLQAAQFDQDREGVLRRLKESGTYTIVIGTDIDSSRRAVELAEANEGIYACIGVHPVDDPKRKFEKEVFDELSKSEKVVAVGECGMDFFQTKKEEDYERQRNLFVEQINFALEKDLPIMIHARSAYAEILEILEPLKKEYGEKLRGNSHFFAGDWETARRFFNIGFSVSFTGVITFTRDYDEVIKKAPLAMIHAETDSPYVAPVPYRGQRCEPAYVSEVYKRLASIRGEEPEALRQALVNNALRMLV